MGLNTQHIFIAGPNRFQNEIMAGLIANEPGFVCFVKHHLEEITSRPEKTAQQKPLILLDCLGLDAKDVYCLLQRQAGKHLKNNLVALFNLGKGLGVERTALTRGVRGLFYENDTGESLCKGLKVVFDGEVWAPRKVMSECFCDHEAPVSFENLPHGLSVREGEVLSLLAVGATNAVIAEQLCISPHTVKTHVYNIFKKIKVPNRMQAALWAAKHL